MQYGFSILMRGISVIGVTMLVIPVNLLLMEGTFPGSVWVVPLLTILMVFLGNFMQSIYASWLGKKSATDALAFDVNTFNRYHYTHAIIPLIIAIVISVLLGILAHGFMEDYLYEVYLDQLYQNNPNAYYVEESLVPYLGVILCFVSQLAGIVIWFYPPVRLNSVYTLIWALGIMFIEFCLYIFTGGLTAHSNLQTVFVICLTVFCVCITILYNQGNLESSYRGSVVSIFKTEDRLYNIFLVLILFFSLAIILFLSYIIVNGIYSLVSTIIWFLLYRILYAGAADNPSKQYEYLEMAERHGKRIQGNGTGNYIGLLLGVLIFGALVFIGIKTGWFKRTFIRLYQWFMEVFGAILQKRNPVGHSEETFYQNYVDEKRKTQNALIREYERMAEHIQTYKDFTQHLAKLTDAGAQLCFAYAVLVRMYAKGNMNLKSSDTPREVEFKVLRAVSGEEIRPITTAFERIKYAEEEIPLEEASVILKSMCEIIHRYMV